jgi:hypothetical protein
VKDLYPVGNVGQMIDYGTYADNAESVIGMVDPEMAEHLRKYAEAYREIDDRLGNVQVRIDDPAVVAVYQELGYNGDLGLLNQVFGGVCPR